MPIENEAKVLDIDPLATADLIVSHGGTQLGEQTLMRRYVYDIRPGDRSKWIRLRDTGLQTTLTIKEIQHDGIDGTHEIETTVGDFDATNELLNKLGYTPKSYQENKRTSFTLAGGRLEIDHWPHIPPYLEIEADAQAEVVQLAQLLGFEEHQLTGMNTIKIYAQQGIDLDSLPYLRFTDH